MSLNENQMETPVLTLEICVLSEALAYLALYCK